MKLGADHRMADQPCPNCREMLGGASCLGRDAGPKPGDVTLCIYCGHVMAFADDLSFRELTKDEMIEVAGDKRILMAQRARLEVMQAAMQKPKPYSDGCEAKGIPGATCQSPNCGC